jgi:pyruvate/2-oxoglutarate dehydrogenase complex dihydrolipoamide acyltransferase (E2) component
VDIALIVEREVERTVVPLPVVIRRCNEKSITQIQTEIDAAVDQSIRGSEDFELGRKRSPFVMSLFYRLPQFLRLTFMHALLARPERRKELMGTAIVTSVAPGLRFPGWIMPETMHNLAFGLGSVVRKPRVVAGEVRPRDVLHLTILFDHDVVDGAPAARFVSRLVKTLESAVTL